MTTGPGSRLIGARACFARSRLGGGGTGLGLTIARDIVRAHGGDILLEERRDGRFAGTNTTAALICRSAWRGPTDVSRPCHRPVLGEPVQPGFWLFASSPFTSSTDSVKRLFRSSSASPLERWMRSPTSCMFATARSYAIFSMSA